MAVVLISRGTCCISSEVADRVARELGYECIAREVLIEASERYNIPEIKLSRAIHNAPSIFDRLSYRKEEYIAFFQATLLRQIQRDNVVYHGNAGQFLVKNTAHVLKVRIVADIEERVRREMERAGISRRLAVRNLDRSDANCRKWGLHLYGMDPADPNLYGMVIHVRSAAIDVPAAAALICRTVRSERFQTTPQSQRQMNDLALAAEIKVALVALSPDVNVVVHDGAVTLETNSLYLQKEVALRRVAEGISGVTSIKCRPRAQSGSLAGWSAVRERVEGMR